MIGGRRPLTGRKLGDRRIKVDRPHTPYFRYTGPGQLTAKAAASVPATRPGRLWARVKAITLGRPLASEEEIGERLAKKQALAIFSSDAISSSAYATEEIILAFILAGSAAAALNWSLPIAIAIAGLLAVVAFSYRQVCIAYPSGGGSYSVSKANFGRIPSLVAASALLVDYNLTAAVSTSSAVEQIVSAFPGLDSVRVGIGVSAILLITIANLRGVREAGNIFAVPTYLFLFGALVMIAIGIYRVLILGEHGVPPPAMVSATANTAGGVSIFILLRAFASGAVALTGTEAIATGVPAFKPPESKNAATTLLAMAGILAVLFVGITFLATSYAIYPMENPKQTVIAQVARTSFGDGVAFYAFQAATALLLFLAANTSFAAFPRLAAVLGEDGFFPRQFSFRGDRLAFSTGIVVLGLVAASLVVAAGGSTHALIPLYAVGVFIDFTISQAGMIRHWLRTHAPGWRYRLVVNAVGCAITAVVAVVVTSVKAPTSLVVIALIPTLVASMLFIRRQYDGQATELEVRTDQVFVGPHREQRVVIPVNGINRAVVQAVNFGRSLTGDIRAVYVSDDDEEAAKLRTRWERQFPGVPLVWVKSPYRALVGPVVAYLDVLDRAWPPDKESPTTIVVLPEYVARHWWDRVLYNQTAKRLKAALIGREHTVIADVPYRRPH
ncbi:MAG: APC family permease [Chloroflexota bacterium]